MTFFNSISKLFQKTSSSFLGTANAKSVNFDFSIFKGGGKIITAKDIANAQDLVFMRKLSRDSVKDFNANDKQDGENNSDRMAALAGNLADEEMKLKLAESDYKELLAEYQKQQCLSLQPQPIQTNNNDAISSNNNIGNNNLNNLSIFDQ